MNVDLTDNTTESVDKDYMDRVEKELADLKVDLRYNCWVMEQAIKSFNRLVESINEHA